MLWRGKPKAGYGVMARRARALLAAALGCAALATGSAAVAAEADSGRQARCGQSSRQRKAEERAIRRAQTAMPPLGRRSGLGWSR